MILPALAAAALLQAGAAAATPTSVACLPDGGSIRRVYGSWTPQGVLTFEDGRPIPTRRPPRPYHEPIARDGKTYRWTGRLSLPDMTFRSFRETRPIGDVPAVALLDSDSTLFVLADPIGCWFDRYQWTP